MQINWGLLQPVDIGANVLQGYQIGEGLVRKHKLQGALAAYSQNPDDPNAQNALASVSPEFAMRLPEMRMRQQKMIQEQQERQRQVALGQRAIADPAGARIEALSAGDFELAKTFDEMGAAQRKQALDEYKFLAPFAYEAMKLPPEQRQAYVQGLAPQLSAAGWDAEELAGLDLSDTGLNRFITMGSTLEQAMGRDEVKWHQVGDRPSFATDSMGHPIGSGNPYAPQIGTHASSKGVEATLSGAGIPAPVVAGFLGNFHVEGGYGGASGDGGTASGIAQWRGERQANFQRVIGKPISQASPEEQARFVLWEMQNPEAAGMTVAQRDAILAAKSPGEAADLIDRFYERSSGKHRDRRIAAAESAFGKGGGAQASPSIGQVVNGYKFLGGNPNSPNSWARQ